jgi:hypothetical protein
MYEQANTLKSFVEQFRNCPKCNSLLKIEARQQNSDGKSNKFLISTNKDKLIINVKSEYFISPRNNHFEFSISIINGNIIYSNCTSQFISLYDLNILLYKECSNCPRPEMFHQSVNIFYDRSDSIFIAEPWMEFFSFVYDNTYYYFNNNFRDKKSFLSIRSLDYEGKIQNHMLEMPFLSFEKFEFRDREKLFSKINSIRLLV